MGEKQAGRTTLSDSALEADLTLLPHPGKTWLLPPLGSQSTSSPVPARTRAPGVARRVVQVR